MGSLAINVSSFFAFSVVEPSKTRMGREGKLELKTSSLISRLSSP